VVFVWRLEGASSGAFFLGISIYCYFIFRPRSLNTHAPFGFFFYLPAPPPRGQLGCSLAIKHAKKYAHVVRVFGLNFCFLKDCLSLANSPPFDFAFPLLQFFDQIETYNYSWILLGEASCCMNLKLEPRTIVKTWDGKMFFSLYTCN
jgi:hypothetical protein